MAIAVHVSRSHSDEFTTVPFFFFVQDNKNFCEEACSTNPVKNKHEEKPN